VRDEHPRRSAQAVQAQRVPAGTASAHVIVTEDGEEPTFRGTETRTESRNLVALYGGAFRDGRDRYELYGRSRLPGRREFGPAAGRADHWKSHEAGRYDRRQCNRRPQRMLRRVGTLRFRLRLAQQRRTTLRRLRHPLRGAASVPRRNVRLSGRVRPLLRSLYGARSRSEQLRQMRQLVRRDAMHRRLLLVRRNSASLQRHVYLGGGRSDELRHLRQRVRRRLQMRSRRMRSRLPDGADGLRHPVRQHANGPEKLRAMQHRLCGDAGMQNRAMSVLGWQHDVHGRRRRRWCGRCAA
jgi:hypothetical protein